MELDNPNVSYACVPSSFCGTDLMGFMWECPYAKEKGALRNHFLLGSTFIFILGYMM